MYLWTDHRPHGRTELPVIPRSESTSKFQPLEDKEVEYFFASDASAVIEHTDRVIFLEDDDVAAVKEGALSIHRPPSMYGRSPCKRNYYLKDGNPGDHEG